MKTVRPRLHDLHHRLRRFRAEVHETHALVQDMATRVPDARDGERTTSERLWVAPGHFYSPIVDLGELSRRRALVFDREAQPAGIDVNRAGQLELLADLQRDSRPLPFDERDTPCRYAYDNDAFSYGDAIVLARILEHFRPRRVLEFGSGYSSSVMLDMDEHRLGWQVDCTFVDPHPELLLRLLKPGDRERVDIIASPAQDVPLELAARLEPDDVLFIDSTHVSKAGSDVNHHLFNVLPRLSPGVLIHFHDVFWPFEYPESWFFAGNRSWNECYLLRAFLMNNRDYRIELFNDYLGHTAREAIQELCPTMLRNVGGSLWLRKLR